MAGVTLDTRKLDQMTKDIRPGTARILQQYGFAIAGEAASLAPVDTGALRNSVTSESHLESDDLFIVQDGVEYGVFQELGTSKMAAHPFIVPAVEHWRARFLAAFAGLFK